MVIIPHHPTRKLCLWGYTCCHFVWLYVHMSDMVCFTSQRVSYKQRVLTLLVFLTTSLPCLLKWGYS